MEFSQKDITRFLSKIKKSETGCWEWQDFKLPRGYGFFGIKFDRQLAHRASYQLYKGPIGEGLEVMHSCDNPSCVNPNHLSLGTRTDNMRDAKKKGRTARGANHGRSKLTEDEAIYALVTPLSQNKTARFLGVSQTTISEIRSGKKWTHLLSVGG